MAKHEGHANDGHVHVFYQVISFQSQQHNTNNHFSNSQCTSVGRRNKKSYSCTSKRCTHAAFSVLESAIKHIKTHKGKLPLPGSATKHIPWTTGKIYTDKKVQKEVKKKKKKFKKTEKLSEKSGGDAPDNTAIIPFSSARSTPAYMYK